jgi:hypothetical protein
MARLSGLESMTCQSLVLPDFRTFKTFPDARSGTSMESAARGSARLPNKKAKAIFIDFGILSLNLSATKS